jgi:hypothetical protein
LGLTLIGSMGISNSATPAIHANALAGDLAIYSVRAGNSAGIPADVTPTDWVNGPNLAVGGSATRSKIMAGVLTADDITTGTITGPVGTGQTRAILTIFRPDQPISSFVFAHTGGQHTNGDPDPQVIAASGDTPPLIVCAGYGVAGTTAVVDPRTWTGSTPTSDTETDQFFFLHEIVNSGTPADVTVDMDDEGTGNVLLSACIEITEAAGAIGWDPESATAGHTAAPFDLTSQAGFTSNNPLVGHTAAPYILSSQAGYTPVGSTAGHTASPFDLTSQASLSLANAIVGHTANALGFTVASSFEINDALAGHTAVEFDLDIPLVFRIAAPQTGHTASPFALSSQIAMGVATGLQGHRSNPYLAFVPRQGPYDLSVYPDTRAFIVTPDGRALSVPVRAEFFDVKGETRVLIVPQRVGTVYCYEDPRVGPNMRTFAVPPRQVGNIRRQGSASQDTTQPLDTDFLQLEDGTYLLQEDGSNIEL